MPIWTRLVCAVLALVICAWFALGGIESHDINVATNLVGGLQGRQKLTAAQAAQARSLLASAAVLNPDQQVNVLRARVALLRKERPLAVEILNRVLSEEPDYLDAWYGLATSASSGATVNRAIAHINQLQPAIHSH
jgi:predicted Zn-dependent protease